jgi:hypothetical protein
MGREAINHEANPIRVLFQWNYRVTILKHQMTVLGLCILSSAIMFLTGCTTSLPTRTVTPDVKGVYPSKVFTLRGDTAAPTETHTPSWKIPWVVVRTPERHVYLRVEPVNIINHIGMVVPREGFVFVSCYLYLVNYSDNSYKVGPEVIIVTDSNSNKYSSVPWSLEPPFTQGLLSSGENKSGFITFEVPETAQNLVLSIEFTLPSESFTIRTLLGH